MAWIFLNQLNKCILALTHKYCIFHTIYLLENEDLPMQLHAERLVLEGVGLGSVFLSVVSIPDFKLWVPFATGDAYGFSCPLYKKRVVS